MTDIHHVIRLDECSSTNSYMASVVSGLSHGAVVITDRQTAGRGQRGNSWEAMPGKNLTFSLFIKPDAMPARDQFYISEAVALGITDILRPLLPDNAVAIKWPNDIYVDDCKICGILIENSLIGSSVGYSIAGIGLNVNQQSFYSDSPNPVSLVMLTGVQYDLSKLLDDVVDAILSRLLQHVYERHADYMSSLYRREGAGYRDMSTGEEFHAIIAGIAPTGHMTLLDTEGNSRTYAFKEVALVL